MAKKDKQAAREEPRAAADYYKLNVRAVDELVNAGREDAPPVSGEELRKYGVKPRLRMAEWLKAALIKAWFGGMVCFFFLWGLGLYVQAQMDLLLIVGLALGFVTDLIVNPIFRFLAKTPGGNDRWMMCPQKRYLSLPLNVLYGFLLLFCVVMTYNGINALLISASGAQDTLPLGVEPVLFGVFTMGWDMLFLFLKRTAGKMLMDARKAARRK